MTPPNQTTEQRLLEQISVVKIALTEILGITTSVKVHKIAEITLEYLEGDVNGR